MQMPNSEWAYIYEKQYSLSRWTFNILFVLYSITFKLKGFVNPYILLTFYIIILYGYFMPNSLYSYITLR